MCGSRILIAASLVLLQSSCATRLYSTLDEDKPPVIEKKISAPVNQSPRDLAGRVLLRSGIGGYFGGGRPPLALIDLGEDGASPPQSRMVYSLGLIPSKVEVKRRFRLVNRMPTARRTTDYEIRYVKRMSVWERFKLFHRDEGTLARGLAWAYVRDRRG